MQLAITGRCSCGCGRTATIGSTNRLVINLDNRPLERSDMIAVKPFEIGPAE